MHSITRHTSPPSPPVAWYSSSSRGLYQRTNSFHWLQIAALNLASPSREKAGEAHSSVSAETFRLPFACAGSAAAEATPREREHLHREQGDISLVVMTRDNRSNTAKQSLNQHQQTESNQSKGVWQKTGNGSRRKGRKPQKQTKKEKQVLT